MTSPPKYRVVHVVLSLDCGGLERVVVSLAREARVLGHRVAVVCLERPGVLADEARRFGVEVRCAEKPPGLRAGTVGVVRRHLRELAPEVVHTHQVGALLYAALAANGPGRPILVHTEHGKHYSQRARTRWIGWLAGRAVRRFFCVSDDIAREVRRHGIVPPGKIVTVPNGVDTAKFLPTVGTEQARARLGIPAGVPVIGTVGRLTEIKRQDVLLKAAAALPAAAGRPHVVLVGDGPRREELAGLAATLGIADRTHFAGYAADPESYYGLMTVFALTSRSEGMPLAVLEAWAAGLPVVATAVGGIPDLVTHDETGLLVASDDVPALAGHLAATVTDPARAARLGAAGRRLVRDRYDVAVMARTYDRHYQDLLDRQRRRLACAF